MNNQLLDLLKICKDSSRQLLVSKLTHESSKTIQNDNLFSSKRKLHVVFFSSEKKTCPFNEMNCKKQLC